MITNQFHARVIEVTDADAAYAKTLEALLEFGLEVSSGQSLSARSGQTSRELLNFSMVLTHPVNRVLRNPIRSLNLPAAVARFVWMMAGSDRLADIAFYEPKVTYFSDDGISVPGSNYGQRLLQPRPGLNQLISTIQRLKDDPSSRRAAMSIYHPEDAVRNSRDIPCAFGMFYHIRNGGLHATTIMRSNNAFVLLPYNLFEFSLLAEVVAMELRVELATLTHSAASMHVFQEHIQKSQEIISGEAQLDRSDRTDVPQMPSSESPVAEIRKLVKLEAQLRHESGSLSEANVEDWIQRGSHELNHYWRQLFFLLIVHVAVRNGSVTALNRLRSVLSSPWLEYLPRDTFDRVSPPSHPQKDLFELEAIPSKQGIRVVPLHKTRAHQSLRRHVANWEADRGTDFKWRAFAALEDRLGGQIAARGESDLTQSEFESLLKEVLESNSDLA